MLSERLAALGLILPASHGPVAAYVPARRHRELLFMAGHVSRSDGLVVTGVVGDDVDPVAARELARSIALDLLASAVASVGSVDAVVGVVRLGVFVRSAAGFSGQPAVADGASELFLELFGEAGRHARAAVGVSDLPLGAAVEIDAVFELA